MNDIKGLMFVIFYAVCGECLYAQPHIGAKSFLNKDLSCLFEDLGMIGILGDDYSRIDIRFIEAEKITDTCYEVRGVTRTRLTIVCQLRGKILIDSITSAPQKSEDINMDGMIYGHYSLSEIGNDRYCGTFTGAFKQAFRIEGKKLDKAINDIIELKINLSEYIGKWQSKYGKSKKSNWADEIIPGVPNDFCSFNDAGEWIVNPTYRKCGWDNLYNAYYNFQLPEDEIIKARDIEECEWYMKNEDIFSICSYPLKNGYELCYEIINDSIQQYVLVIGNDEKVISSEPYYGELNDKFRLHYDNIDFDDYVVLVEGGSNYNRRVYLFSKKSGENIFKDKCYIEVDYDMNENLILYFNAQEDENPNGNLTLFDLKNQKTIEIDVELFAKNKQLSNYYYTGFSILNANNTYVTIAYSDEDTITNTFKRDYPKEDLDITKVSSRFNLEYYQEKIHESCGELSIPFSCYYTELDSTQKRITITDKGYSLSIIRPRSFFRELKQYHKNTIIKREGTKLFMSNVNVGIWREYNEQGTLINEIDEDRKFDSLRFKPLDVLRYMENEGYISLKTGEGQERFDKQNEINIYFKDKQKSKDLWSKREPAKWMIEFYDIEKGQVITHVINAESGEIISKTKQFLEE